MPRWRSVEKQLVLTGLEPVHKLPLASAASQGKTMTKQQLIARVAKVPGLPPKLTKKTVVVLVDAVFRELGDYFIKSKITRRATPRFTYPGFGTFTKKRRRARAVRNPQTGAPLNIPATTTLAFQPGVELRAFLNRGPAKKLG